MSVQENLSVGRILGEEEVRPFAGRRTCRKRRGKSGCSHKGGRIRDAEIKSIGVEIKIELRVPSRIGDRTQRIEKTHPLEWWVWVNVSPGLTSAALF